MRLAEYVDREGWGSIQRISDRSNVSYQTVHAAAKHATAISKYEIAKAISDATDGEVTVADLCEPAAPTPAEVA